MGSGASRGGKRALKAHSVPDVLRRAIDDEFALSATDERIGTAFKQWDVDGNGVLTIEELLLVIKNSGLKITMSELQLAFNSADADRDGSIGFDDFARWLYPPTKLERT